MKKKNRDRDYKSSI